MQRRKKTYYKTGFFGYGIFTLTQSRKTLSMTQKVDIYHLRKYEAFTLTQTCKLNIELTVSKNCDQLFSLMSPFKHLYGTCGPQGGKSW